MASVRRAEYFSDRTAAVAKSSLHLRKSPLAFAAESWMRSYFRRIRSLATKSRNTTEITPFMVKNAAFSLLRSS